MAKGAKSIAYKELLNALEEQQPGAKHRFLTGFLKQGRNAVAAGNGLGDGVDLGECTQCGQPTTAAVCQYCRLEERGRRTRFRKELSVLQ